MALIQMNLESKLLRRTVPVQVLLPADKVGETGYLNPPEKKYKTLYLLHGYLGNYTDWVCNTMIRKWAEEKNLAVVMPSGENSFYVEQDFGWNDFGRYVSEELVEITRRIFPLSRKREDTFLGGLSMGGFGAVRNGLLHPETFSIILEFSGAFHVTLCGRDDPRCQEAFPECRKDDETWAALLNSDKNPEVCLKKLVEKVKNHEAQFPKIFMACGAQDPLVETNRVFRDIFRAAGIETVYEEAPGTHDWYFWNTYIQKAILQWLPLEDSVEGINSGNIGKRE